MSLVEFYVLISVFVILATLMVVVPLSLSRSKAQQDALTNTQLVKGRLQEIEREITEGLLNQADKKSAENEVKLALIDEQQQTHTTSTTSPLGIAVGAFFAVAVGITVYINVHHLSGVKERASAPDNLQALSAKLIDPEQASTIQPQDIQQLALAIRLRLREFPEDAQGWMFLGRLRVTLGQVEEAIAAYERSLQLRPDNTMTQVSYAQALIMTNEETALNKAQRELGQLLLANPDNDNLTLMMAVTAAQLGNLDIAQSSYDKIKDKLAANNPMRQTIEARLADLGGNIETNDNEPSISVTIDIAEALRNRLPEQAFLVVFARDGIAKQGMPIAVKRQTVSGFPTTLTLGDSDAMVPELTLSKFDAVNLTARISSTPNVGSQSGDLEGTLVIESLATGPNDYAIEINKEIQ